MTLRHLVLTHGRPRELRLRRLPGGGAISNRGTLTLIDSLVTENEAYFGGGIYNIGTLTLIRSRVSDHGTGWPDDEGAPSRAWRRHLQHRDRDPGGLGRLPQQHGLRRVPASSTAGTMTLRRSRVSDNGSNYMGSGGIVNTGTLILVDSAVTRNSGYDGGGIGNSGTVRLTGSTVSDNTSYTDGGGIFNDRHGTVTLRGGSRVTANTASAAAAASSTTHRARSPSTAAPA